MRKVVAYELLSLDGVAEQPDEYITEFDEVMQENLGRIIAAQDTVVLGRRTYDDWAAFWPTSEIEPFASFINGVQKFVVSSTPPEPLWENTGLVAGRPEDFVLELKQQSGRAIGIHGSISLIQSLLAAGVVDELQLVIAPAVHQRGRKLFDGGSAMRLSLIRGVVSPTGYLLLGYQVRS